MHHLHIRISGQMSGDDFERRQAAARENVAFDEVYRAARLFVARVGNGDSLNHHFPVAFKKPAATLKIAAVEVVADRLDHLDRHQLIVLSGERAVVFKEHGDAILKPQFPHPGPRELVLLAGDRGRGDFAAVVSGRVDRHTPPAGADFQQMLVAAQFQAPADLVELVDGGFFQGGFGALEQRGRIHHGGIEKQAKKVVAQIVVG